MNTEPTCLTVNLEITITVRERFFYQGKQLIFYTPIKLGGLT